MIFQKLKIAQAVRMHRGPMSFKAQLLLKDDVGRRVKTELETVRKCYRFVWVEQKWRRVGVARMCQKLACW